MTESLGEERLSATELEALPALTPREFQYRWREDSPDGRWAFTYFAQDGRMSHWFYMGQLYRRHPFARLVVLGGYGWDCASGEYEDPETVAFYARKYPGDRPAVRVRIRLADERASVRLASGRLRDDMTLPELEAFLRAY